MSLHAVSLHELTCLYSILSTLPGVSSGTTWMGHAAYIEHAISDVRSSMVLVTMQMRGGQAGLCHGLDGSAQDVVV